MTLPKVLILNQPFIKTTGGGITLSNLFKGWDKDNIAVACTPHYFNLEVDTDVCDTYYRLGEKEYKNNFPFNLLQHKYPSGPVDFGEEGTFHQRNERSSENRVSRSEMLNKFVYPTLEYLGAFHNLSRIELSNDFCKWMDDYNPDVIYAQAFSLEGVRFSLAVEAYLKKPMVFHMMDDWPSSASERGLLKKYWANKIDSDFRLLLNRSSLLLSISEGMAEAYKSRYKKTFIPFHNPIQVGFWKKWQRSSYDLKDNPTLLYSGRTGLGIDISLEQTAQAVEKVNSDLGVSLKFVLRSGEKPDWIKKYPSAIFKNYVDYEDVPKTLAEADLLILPYDFSEDSIKFIKYSMPTKASEYMMSGTPTIFFGPPETALSQYAQKYDCFRIVNKNNITALTSEIKELVLNKVKRKEVAQKAAKLAEAKHAASSVVSEFRKHLRSVAHS